MTDLGDPRYIRFTNFRRNGDAVSTPVWFARMGAEWVFSSNPDVGKVKRLRNNPAVEITACDVRGRVKPGTPVFGGTARLLGDDEVPTAEAAMGTKYGLQWRLLGIGDVLRRLVRRPAGSAFIAVSLGEQLRTE